jgi:CubicO group peptidase (beta-lactamase class C family)
MRAALELTRQWPVDNVSAAVVGDDVHAIGDQQHVYRIASVAKLLVGWTAMVAVEEGTITLDDPVGQPGCTVRHLLAHAGGYAFDGPDPIARPGTRRIYSNTGIELFAAHLEQSAGMPVAQYIDAAVSAPLGMRSTEVRGSPAHAVWSTCADLTAFARELITPTLITRESAHRATTTHFAELAGIVPGLGRYDPCPWGLGFEVRGTKSPHWTGRSNTPATFGHFGGAGTILWVDPSTRAGPVACIALTDRPFDDWSADALTLWPAFGDAVLAAAVAP